jgi:glyoxylase-like metal-dependent hydrolase (beta-lactamase superfamily II)
MLTIKLFCFNDFSENTLIIQNQPDCMIVDPGCYQSGEVEELIGYLTENKLRPVCIVNTHCHVDHVLGVDKIKNHYHIPFIIGKNETAVLKSVKLFAPVYGFTGYVEPEPDRLIGEGEILTLGSQRWEVLEVPGHSPGHIALLNREEFICISGDVLFNQSIGRTDLPGGNYDTLIDSIRNKLFTLPDETRIIPGHGPETTVRDEKKFNPFCGENVI